MGNCSTTKNAQEKNKGALKPLPPKQEEQKPPQLPRKPEDIFIHSLKRHFEEYSPDTKEGQTLQFELHLNNFKVKFLQPDKFYYIEIQIPSHKGIIREFLPVTKGPHPRFIFDKKYLFEIEFEKLKNSFFKLYLFTLPENYSNIKINFETNRDYTSCLLIDMLTVALGPEHHDIGLQDSRTEESVGRFKGNISCNHIAPILISIDSLSCFLKGQMDKKTAFKLNYKDEEHILDSDYSSVNLGSFNKNEGITEYKWFPGKNKTEEFNDDVQIDNVMLSVIDFRSGLLIISVNDFTVEMVNDKTKEEKEVKAMTKALKRQSIVERTKTIFIGGDENLTENLVPKYTYLGSATLNTYALLKENEELMERQRSEIFLKTISVYNQKSDNRKKPVNDENLNKSEDNIRKEKVKIKIFDSVKQSFKEDIFSTGVIIGWIEGNITLKNIPLIRQVMCGVHTEKGLDLNSAYLGIINVNILNGKDDELPKDLEELNKNGKNLYKKVCGNNLALTITGPEYKQNNNEISQLLDEITKNLQFTGKESILFYNYNSFVSILTGMQIFIDLGMKILSLVESFNIDHRIKSFKILSLIIERGEIDLEMMSKIDNPNETYPQFKEICFNLMAFHNSLLNICLTNFGRKATDENTKKFIENTIGILYFRVPVFQKEFLDIIISAKDPTTNSDDKEKPKEDTGLDNTLSKHDNNVTAISEKDYVEQQLKNYEIFDEEDKIEIKNPIVSLIDWSNLFYNKIKKMGFQKEVEEKEEEARSAMNSKKDWKKRLWKKGLAFFSIIKKLEEYFQKKMIVKRDINWMLIPGFKIIISSILLQLKTYSTTTYPQALIDSLKIFINKPYLMNTFFSIIVEKTNVFDTNAVFTLFKILDSFFTEWELKKAVSSFNNKFDYNKLKQAMIVIIENDHSLCVGKLIWFYYKNANKMPIDHVHGIVTRMFENIFFKHFFHWSWQVRNMFYYFLLYTVGHQIANKSFQGDKLAMVNERMELLKMKDANLMGRLGANFNYPEIQKKEILSSYYEKARIIQMIKRQCSSKELDPTYNTSFETDNDQLNKILTPEIRSRIAVSIHHYNIVEDEYNQWIMDNKDKKGEIVYPEIELQPPRDDVIEHSSEINKW